MSQVDFQSAFNQAGVALALLSPEGRFLWANPSFSQVLGYETGELPSRQFACVVGLDNESQLLAQFESQQNSDKPLQSNLTRKNGEQIWASLTPSSVRDDSGRVQSFLLHIQDQTERRRLTWLEDDRRQVLEMIAQDQPLPSILNQLVRFIERQIPGTWACIMLLQDGTMRPFAPSVPEKLTDALGRRPVSFAAGLAATPPHPGGSIRLSPVGSDPAWAGIRTEAQEAAIQCCWSITITGGDSVALGMLVLLCPFNRPPSVNEGAVFDIAMRLATIAIEHHLTTRQLAHLVRHDPLTGLPNRILFEDRLHHSIATVRRSGRPLALLALDLNRFKIVNDTLGHQAGDCLLQQFAHRLRSKLRESDTLARVGGDEFMLILSDVNGREDAELVTRRLKESLASAPFEVAGRLLTASSSIGIAMYPADGDDALLLQRAADAAMYRVKELERRGDAGGRAVA